MANTQIFKRFNLHEVGSVINFDEV